MVSSSSIQDSDNAPANQNPIIVTNETHNQNHSFNLIDKMKEKNLPAAFATSVAISLFIAACVDPCILSINGVSEKGCASPCVGLFSKSSTECTTSGQLYAIYGSLFVTFALFLECISFITESAGFTYPLFLKLFRRYGILHFFAVIFVMISAGLWYGFSEHLMHNLDQYPKERGSKVIIDFSRAYWYMVTAAVAALVGAALNVLRIYEESVDEDQQRLIPEELRHSYFIITRPPDNPQPPPYVLCE